MQRDALYVNLFVGSTADIKLYNGHTVKLVQETRYGLASCWVIIVI